MRMLIKKRYENMRKIINDLDRRIPITIKKALVVEAQNLGFDTIDAYIQYLKARLNDCEKQKKDFMQVIEAYSQKDKEAAKKEPIVIPTPE
jgi:Ca2+-binding EF-hand superfamily protein